jgi:hypothetical protein
VKKRDAGLVRGALVDETCAKGVAAGSGRIDIALF